MLEQSLQTWVSLYSNKMGEFRRMNEILNQQKKAYFEAVQ